MVAAALVVAALAAAVDWIAVARDRRRVEYIAKPLVMIALLVVAMTLDPTDAVRRNWFVAAGVFALAGDVFLMLPRDLFVAGLLSFLVAHLSYIAGLLQAPWQSGRGVVGLLVVAAAVVLVGRPVLQAVRRTAPALLAPVVIYLVVIATMVVVAFATGPLAAIAGAVLFLASDSLLALERFVRQTRRGSVAVMVTYHLAQACLVLSLPAG